MIKETRQQSANVLLLDAGNALWSQQPLAAASEGKVLIEAMNLMGYDAMALANQELDLGAEVLQERIADAEFPILSCNVLLASDQKPVAQPYVILDVGGHKVGILGLTYDYGQTTSTAVRGDFVLLSAAEAVVKYVAELRGQTDIIIVLSSMGHEVDMGLGRMVPGIDLILGSRSRVPTSTSYRDEKTGTLVAQAGFQGQWIGRRTLHFDSSGIVTSHQDELILLADDRAEDAEMRSFLNNYQVE